MKPERLKNFLALKAWRDERVMLGLWVIIGAVAALTKLHSNNNFMVFRSSFLHTIAEKSIYAYYPEEYSDHNLYGPFFSIIVAPFATCPIWLGQLLWCVAMAVFLFWAIKMTTTTLKTPADSLKLSTVSDGKTPLDAIKDKGNYLLIFTIWFCAHELLTALFMQQFNVAVAAMILLSYVFVEKERDHWATLMIAIGFFIKLYGIVGLAFFFFSKHKLRFALSLIGWTILLFCLPMLISSAEYQVSQWQEWFTTLTSKNEHNFLSRHQNISLLGIVRKVGYGISGGNEWWLTTYKDAWIILIGIVMQAAGFFRIGQWKHLFFRLNILAAVLMFVVLFSTGSESSGYIIALSGCCIWYVCVPWKRNRWDIALMIFAFIITSFSPSDLFPRSIRENLIMPYALKALPVALIWAKQIIELITRDYKQTNE